MNDLNELSALHKIMACQAMIMSALAILLIPGAETSQASLRMEAARELNKTASEIWEKTKPNG